MNCNLLKLSLMGVGIFAMSGCKSGANQSAASSPDQYAPGRATVRALNPIVPPDVYIAAPGLYIWLDMGIHTM